VKYPTENNEPLHDDRAQDPEALYNSDYDSDVDSNSAFYDGHGEMEYEDSYGDSDEDRAYNSSSSRNDRAMFGW
jgi:hypothetical protein